MNSRQLAQTWPYRRYKAFENDLRESAARWISEKGFSPHSRMAYCLKSRDEWKNNIICAYVAEYIRKEDERNRDKESFPLHKYLHHGLSSQAMVFNLVGPLILRRNLEPFIEAIEQAGIQPPKGNLSAEFEYDDRNVFNEDSGQPTSLDLAIFGESGKVFIEAKLVERDFGGCSVFAGGDCDGRNPIQFERKDCYLDHIGRKYLDLMEKFGITNMPISSGPICPFINYYQFFREVLFALAKGGSFILLHDDRNPAFFKVSEGGKEAGLWPFLLDAIPETYRSRIGRITIQQVVKSIEDSGSHWDWIGDFKEKYGMNKEC